MKQIIKSPMISEKSLKLRESEGVYVFKVDMDSCKSSIAQAVEKSFNVKVSSVRTLVGRGKAKQMKTGMGAIPRWKKAYVKLAKGNKITLFEGA